jgi:hypothetical protein
MKFAIKLSALPPAVIYATINRPVGGVVDILKELDVGVGVCGLVHKVLEWLGQQCSYFELVEDGSRIVSTDTRDADILIIKVPTGWDVHEVKK